MRKERNPNLINNLIDSVINQPEPEDWDYKYIPPPDVLLAKELIPKSIREEVWQIFLNTVGNPITNKYYREIPTIQCFILQDIANKHVEKYYEPISGILIPKNGSGLPTGKVDIWFKDDIYTYRGITGLVTFPGESIMKVGHLLEYRNYRPTIQEPAIAIPPTTLVMRVMRKKFVK